MWYIILRHVWWAGRRGSWNNSHGNQVTACWNLLSKNDRASRCRGSGIWQGVAEINVLMAELGFQASLRWSSETKTTPLPSSPSPVPLAQWTCIIPHLLTQTAQPPTFSSRYLPDLFMCHTCLAENLSAALRFPEDGVQPPGSQGGSSKRED